MKPSDLRAESFANYPPRARALAAENLNVFKRMPLLLLALVLRQVAQYDWSFPAEREQLLRQLNCLSHMDVASFDSLMSSFSVIPFATELTKIDWVNHPQRFSEQLTANLWSQHQIDSYHSAAQKYQQYLQKALPETLLAAPRWTIVVIGSGVQQTEYPLFRRLMPHGTLFTQLDPKGGARYAYGRGEVAYPAISVGVWPLVHRWWRTAFRSPRKARADNYVVCQARTCRKAGVWPAESVHGPDESPRDCWSNGRKLLYCRTEPRGPGSQGECGRRALRHFEVNLLTQGAGCQIFSTTFVQWAARECLHRAQPLTLFARFATRQSNAPMEQLLMRDPLRQPQDKEGSLIDADMGAYYSWINQSRLAGAEQSRFLVWFEDHSLACAIAPTLPRGTTSTTPITMRQILQWMG